MELNGKLQLFVYADDVNMLGEIYKSFGKIQKYSLASKDISLEVNSEKAKYMIMSFKKNAVQNIVE